MAQNILIIDDERTLREEIRDILLFEDFSVIEAANGREGVQLARAHTPDLIICDVMMPEMDGYSTLMALRNSPDTAVIPFIFLTAQTQRINIRHGMESGANDYLTKPFTTTELLGAVKTRLVERTTINAHYEKKMDNLRSALIHTLPHELRTPLVSILGYAELLNTNADNLTTEQIKKMAESVLKGGQRLYRLIEQYQIYAQIEILSRDVEKLHDIRMSQTVNARQVVSNAAIKQADLAGRASDLHLQLDEADTPVQISEDTLKKIIEELVGNAFKFSKPGKAVTVTSISNHGRYDLRIADQGRGMSAEQIRDYGAYVQFNRNLFEQQGLGLGLVIAQGLVEMHAGSIMIESTLNQGTTVVVRLPLAIKNGHKKHPHYS